MGEKRSDNTVSYCANMQTYLACTIAANVRSVQTPLFEVFDVRILRAFSVHMLQCSGKTNDPNWSLVMNRVARRIATRLKLRR